MNIILERSDELISLGRLVWALKTKEADLNPTRIDISRAYVSILEEAGKPLTEKELKQRLSTKRGIDPHQQIYPNEKMIAILPGLWGLVDRDIPISQQEQETLLNILYEVLQEREKALHLTEIQKSIEDFGFRFQKKPHDYTLFRLAQSDSRFKVGQGQLLGLITWEKFNRLSLSQAVKKVMNDSSPLNSDVIWKRSEKLAERCVDKQTVVSILQNLGGYYNTERDLWEYPDSKKE